MKIQRGLSIATFLLLEATNGHTSSKFVDHEMVGCISTTKRLLVETKEQQDEIDNRLYNPEGEKQNRKNG